MRSPKDIKIGNYTLEEILERHQHWLNGDCEKWEYMRADLSCANLHGANLHGASLQDANLHGADLTCANLHGANLHGANLQDANLSCANLHGADLHGANLHGANLQDADPNCADLHGADLSCANLHGANLQDADLNCADLSCAYLHGADLHDADLNCADLSCAYLHGADLHDADLSCANRLRKGVKLSEPIIGWKKCKNNILVKLEIPRGAIVFSINNNECRTDKAKVLEIIGANRAYSKNKFFSYYVGDIIEVFNFNCEYNIESAEGIHFFKTREEAEDY